jgi:hypothetical protein
MKLTLACRAIGARRTQTGSSELISPIVYIKEMTMSPLPDCFDLNKYAISPADAARLFFRCEPEEIRENVVITPIWYRHLTAVHGHVVREVSERVIEADYGGLLVTVIRSDVGAPNTGDVVLALGATGCRRLVDIQAAALLMVSDVIPAKKSLFSGRTGADREKRKAVRRNQLPESIFRALLYG